MDDKCSKCGSTRIIPVPHVLDRTGYSEVSFLTNPNARVFKGQVYAHMRANICGECGYTEFFAQDPAALYDKYLQGKQ